MGFELEMVLGKGKWCVLRTGNIILLVVVVSVRNA